MPMRPKSQRRRRVKGRAVRLSGSLSPPGDPGLPSRTAETGRDGPPWAREESEKDRVADEPSGYRNGYGRPRRLTLSLGTLEVRRPRVRNREERVVSRVCPSCDAKAGRFES